jgi:Conserved hypothetical protein 2217 (DUF2460)
MSSLPIFPVLPGLTFTSLKTPKFNTLVPSAPNAYEVRIAQTINPVWTWTLLYEFLHDFPWGTSFANVSELRTLMGFFCGAGGKAASFLFDDPDDDYVGPALSTVPWAPLTLFPVGFGILDSANHWQKVTSITTGYTGSTIPTFNHSGSTTADAGVVWTDQGAYTSAGFPNCPLAQLGLVTDGAGNYYTPLQRTLNGAFYEDVTDLNNSIYPYNFPQIYANGVYQDDYTLMGPGLQLPTGNFMGLYLKWNTFYGIPAEPITGQFNYYFRVRFETDSLDFEKFLGAGQAAIANKHNGGYYTIGGSNAMNGTGTLKLTTSRPVPP